MAFSTLRVQKNISFNHFKQVGGAAGIMIVLYHKIASAIMIQVLPWKNPVVIQDGYMAMST